MSDISSKAAREILIHIATSGSGKANSDLGNLNSTANQLSRTVNETENSFKKLMAMLGAGYSLDLTINKFLDINKQMILSTSQFRKYGMSIEKTKGYMRSLSKEISLTQQETMSMMDAFETSMPTVSLLSMTKILKNIKQVTGSNADAMKNYLSIFSSLSSKFPEMQSMLSNLTDEHGNLNKAAAERLRAQNRMLAMTGIISLSESKAITNQIEGLKKRTMAESALIKKQQGAQDSAQQFRQTYEELSIVVGNTILPAMQTLSKILEDNSFFVKDILKFAAKTLPIVTAMAAGFAIVKGAAKIGGIAKGALSLGGLEGRTEGYKSPLDRVKGAAKGALGIGGEGKLGSSKNNAMWVRDSNTVNQIKDMATRPSSSIKNILQRKGKPNPYDLAGAKSKKGGLGGLKTSIKDLTAKVPGIETLSSQFGTIFSETKSAINSLGNRVSGRLKGLSSSTLNLIKKVPGAKTLQSFLLQSFIGIRSTIKGLIPYLKGRGGKGGDLLRRTKVGKYLKKIPGAKKLGGLAKKIPGVGKLGGLAKKIPGVGKLGGLATKTPGVGKIGGLATKIPSAGSVGKNLLSGVKGAGPGLALTIGGMVTKGLGKKIEASGMKKTGAAVGVAGSGLKVAGAAATGAAIGSVVPILGTAAGGLIGGVIGLAGEMGDIGKGLAKITGDNILTDLISGISTGIKDGLGAIGGFIKGGLGKIGGWIKDSWVGNAVGGYIKDFKEGINMVGEGISFLGNELSEFLYSAIPAAQAYKELREARENFMKSEEKWANMLTNEITMPDGTKKSSIKESTENAINDRQANIVQDSLTNEALAQKNISPLESSAGFTEAEKKFMSGISSGKSSEDLISEIGPELLTADEKRMARINTQETMRGTDFAGSEDSSLGLDVQGLQKYMKKNKIKPEDLDDDRIKALAESGQFGITDFQEKTGVGDASTIKAVKAAASAGSLESASAEDIASGDLNEKQKNAKKLNDEMNAIVAAGKIENMTKEKAADLETKQIELAQIRLKIMSSTAKAFDAQAAKLSKMVELAGEFSSEYLKAQGLGSVEGGLEKGRQDLAAKKDALEMALPELQKTLVSKENTMREELEEDMKKQGMTDSQIEKEMPGRLEAKKITDVGYQEAKASVTQTETELTSIPMQRLELEKKITAESQRKLDVQKQLTSILSEQVGATSSLLQATGSMSDGTQVEVAARKKIAQNSNEIAAIDARIADEKKLIANLEVENLADSQSRIVAENNILSLQNEQKRLRADEIAQLQEVLAFYDAFQQAQSRIASSTKDLLDSTVELSVMTSGLVETGEVERLMQKDIAETRKSIVDINENIAQKMAVAQEIAQEQGKESIAYKGIMADINSLTSQRNQDELKILQTYFAQAKAAEQIKSIQEGYANSQEKLYQSQLEYAALTDNINIDDLLGQYGSVRDSLVEQRDLIKAAITEQEAAIEKVMSDTNASESFKLQKQTELNNLKAQELDIEKKLQSAITGITKAYEQRRKSAQLESDYLAGMVSLQDNLTVGIGASAAMRMQNYAAIGQEMQIMREEQQAIEKAMADGLVPLEQQAQVENRLKELRNEQLSGLQKQNDLVKSLRDGWVGAMTAATNGQGKITKIMVNQEGNLAALQDRFSGIRSSMSGATMRAGESMIGARESQQFNRYGGGIPGTAGIGGGTGIGYMSDVDKWLGLDPAAMSQQMLGGQRGQAVNQFEQAVQRGIGSGQTLGLEGQNKQLLNTPGTGGGSEEFSYSGGGKSGGSTTRTKTQGKIEINCTFNVNTLSEAVTELSKKLKEIEQQNKDVRNELKPNGGAGVR